MLMLFNVRHFYMHAPRQKYYTCPKKCLLCRHIHKTATGQDVCYTSTQPVCISSTLIFDNSRGHHADGLPLYSCSKCAHYHTGNCSLENQCQKCFNKSLCITDCNITKCHIQQSSVCTACDSYNVCLVDAQTINNHVVKRYSLPKICVDCAHYHYGELCVLSSGDCCDNAIPFTLFASHFLLTDTTSGLDVKNMFIPQPTNWTKESTSLFQRIIQYTNTLQHVKRSCIGPERAITANESKGVVNKYEHFINSKFLFGLVSEIKGGKWSYYRRNILGSPGRTNIYRTATINLELMENEIYIPQDVYDVLVDVYDLENTFLNRNPSINTLCIYACKAIRCPDPTIQIIQINPYVVEGLHFDQDGDAVTVYLNPKYTELVGLNHHTAIVESKSFAMTNRPLTYMGESRYSFCLYQRWVMHRYRTRLSALSSFFKEKYCGDAVKFMGLLMLYKPEFVEFQHVLATFIKELQEDLVSVGDLTLDTGVFQRLVDAKSIRSQEYLDAFRALVVRQENGGLDALFNRGMESYNKFVSASRKMSDQGRQNFTMQTATTPLIYTANNIYYYNKILVGNVFDNKMSLSIKYTEAAILDLQSEFIKISSGIETQPS